MLPFVLELPPIPHFVFSLNMKIRICAGQVRPCGTFLKAFIVLMCHKC